MSEYIYGDEYYELRVSGPKAIIHDKKQDTYFETERSAVPDEVTQRLVPYLTKVSPLGGLCVIISLCILCIVNLYSALRTPKGIPGPYGVLILATYAMLSIILHESAHIAILRLCGRPIDKVGFKLHYYIFPAFYVRMSQSHMLAKFERVAVHGAGIIANLTVNIVLYAVNFITIDSRGLYVALNFVTISLVANALPLLNSDGYRVLLAMVDLAERKGVRNNPRWLQVVKLISVLIVLGYAADMLYSIDMELLH